MFFHNKTLLNSIWGQEFQIACKRYEIELKKTASCGFGSPVEVFGAIEQVALVTTKKVFVKLYRSKRKDKSLDKYTILYNINSYTPCFGAYLGLSSLLSPTCAFNKIFEKSGQNSLPLSKDRHCLPLPDLDNPVDCNHVFWLLTDTVLPRKPRP